MSVFFSNIRLFEVICAPNLPFFKKTNFDCVGWAMERTTHAHYALVSKMKVAVLVDFNVTYWTHSRALATMNALFVDFILFAVKPATPKLYSENPSNKMPHKNIFEF